MKKKFCAALAFSLLLGVSFASCSSDDDKEYGPTETIVFDSPEHSVITLNDGVHALGQIVTYTPQGNNRGLITVSGAPLQLTDLMARTSEEQNVLRAPGVLPGSATVSIPVTLSEDGTFAGEGDTDYCTYNYRGKVTNSDFLLSFSDVTLKNTTLSNTTWKLTPLTLNEFGDERLTDPFHIIWDESVGINALGFPLPAQTVVQMMLVMPLIDAGGDGKVSVYDIMPTLLQSVKFGADGTIGGMYVDVDDATGTPREIPAGIASYVVDDASSMRLFLNPYAIMAAQSGRSGRDFDMAAALAQLMQMGGQMLKNGIPLALEVDGDRMKAYLTTETLMPILRLAAEACADPTILEMVNQAIESGQIAMDGMEAMLPSILEQIPAVVESTTKIEIGLDLTRL